MNKVRFAVIGAGNLSQVAILPAFAHVAESCELAAIVSSDPEKRARLTKKHGVAWSGSYEELEQVCKDADVHAAYIALPNHLHREYTERCAAVGVHVLCEKPMAMTAEDCRAMIAACDAANVKLMIAYRLHFEEANLRTLELVKRSHIGAPRYFSSVLSHLVRGGDVRTRADAGGGALYDLGPYCVNAARSLFHDEPFEVMGMQTPGAIHDGDPSNEVGEVDEMTTAMLRFSHGRHAQFTVSQGAASVSEMRIVGTEGDVRLDPAFEYVSGLKQFVTINESAEERSFAKSDQFGPELEYFAMCVRDGVDPEPSGLEGLADVRVLEAIAKSALTGAPVRLKHLDKVTGPDMSQHINKPPVDEQDTVNAPSPSR